MNNNIGQIEPYTQIVLLFRKQSLCLMTFSVFRSRIESGIKYSAFAGTPSVYHVTRRWYGQEGTHSSNHGNQSKPWRPDLYVFDKYGTLVNIHSVWTPWVTKLSQRQCSNYYCLLLIHTSVVKVNQFRKCHQNCKIKNIRWILDR